MSMNVGGSRKITATMNVTPLIDVLLVLLVIFMIITPLTPLGEDALIPQPSKGEPPSPDSIIRTVVLQVFDDAQGIPRLKINEDTVAWPELRGRLRAIYEFRREKVIFVKADDRIDWQIVADAISEAHFAGVTQVALVTRQLEQPSHDVSLVAKR